MLRAGRTGNCCSIPDCGRDFSLLHGVQNGYEVHHTSCPVSTRPSCWPTTHRIYCWSKEFVELYLYVPARFRGLLLIDVKGRTNFGRVAIWTYRRTPRWWATCRAHAVSGQVWHWRRLISLACIGELRTPALQFVTESRCLDSCMPLCCLAWTQGNLSCKDVRRRMML
jgi:hypothetical protein